jgi:hypothetical protein
MVVDPDVSKEGSEAIFQEKRFAGNLKFLNI